ncbi:MAG TPA: acyl carrier protein [Steroidobacteraceae bacterium]|nr:acyl carrier protein [Steroidobacteraceae bacterium]
MDTNEIRAKLLSLLTAIAPDIDPATVDAARDLRDQFDFDSMDALHFATAVSESFGIAVAETDYPQLASLRGAGEFVAARIAAKRLETARETV